MLPVVIAVIKSKPVIMATIAVFLYIDFVFFVARYRKQPKIKAKKRSVAAPAPAPAPQEGEGGGEQAGGGGAE